MISNIFGMVYFILIPPSRLNYAYFICGILAALSGFIMILAHSIPEQAKLTFLIGITLLGISRGAISCPYLLLNPFFSSLEDVVYVNVWFGLTEFGLAWGYLLETWFLYSLKMHWTISLMIIHLLFLAIVILVFLVVPEV